MPFGFDRHQRIFLNDTATLEAYLYDQQNENLIPMADITGVTFSVLKPGDTPATPSVNSAAGTITEDGKAVYTVANSVHTVAGDYRVIARFTYTEGGIAGRVKTIPMSYEVADMFASATPTPADSAIDLAWVRLEDCFDSDQGGPWLRDMTLANFDRNKLKKFIPNTLLTINAQQPPTSYVESSFPWVDRDGAAFFGYGLFIETVKHLMRSYTEQPNVMQSAVGYFDRTRYQQAWKAIYDVEKPEWDRILELWKRSELDIAHGAVLIGNKAGRMFPTAMRTRFTGRGYL